jgi:hypothetical protein
MFKSERYNDSNHTVDTDSDSLDDQTINNPMRHSDDFAPPKPPKIDRGDGNFDFMTDEHSRHLLINAFQAINESETWDFVAKDCESFMFNNSPEIYKISEMMERCIYPPGHSGCSFGWTMRQMQFLAKHGIKKYKLSINN